MKCMILLPLFFSLSVSLSVNLNTILDHPKAFSSVMHTLEPEEVQHTVDEIQELLDIGEAFRQKATEDRDHYLGIRDAATTVRDDAQTSLTETEGNLKHSEEEVVRLQGEKNTAIALVSQREVEKAAADQLVIDEQAELDNENARIDSEKQTLEEVLDILNGLLSKESLQTGSNRKLLSRTATLLSNPSFLAALAKADPTAIARVVDLVNQLIEAGEDARNVAIKEHQDAVDAAAVAVQNLDDANADLARISGELETEEATVAALTAEKEDKEDTLADKQNLLDLAQDDYDAYQKILDDETVRIDGEKDILDDSKAKLEVMVKVIETLN